LVYDRLISAIEASKKNNSLHDQISISQTIVSHPNYKYSVGSFIISYAFKKEMIRINVQSRYQFTPNNDRITQYLHNWLVDLMDKGNANNFKIESDTWTLSYSSLLATKTNAWLRKKGTMDVLYV